VVGIIIFAVTFASFGFLSTDLDTIFDGTQIAGTNAKTGDEIVNLNGNRIYTQLDLSYVLYNAPNSEPMTMILRSKDSNSLYSVTLTPTITSKYRLGITVMSGLDVNNGMAVVDVDPTQNGGNPVFKKGDSLIAVNGISVDDPTYANVVSASNGNELTATIIRDGVKQDIKLTATIFDTANERGIYLLPGTGIASLLKESVLYSVSIIKVSVLSLGDIAKGKIKAQDAVTGPVGIATIVSNVVDAPKTDNSVKLENLGTLAGLISVGLAFSNMLPLPGLDGNALILLVVEMIRGRKLSLQTERVINAVGFVVLIALVIFALSSDIMRLVG
jgi:regulator of sigma E protease